jgi:hypothetical protein
MDVVASMYSGNEPLLTSLNLLYTNNQNNFSVKDSFSSVGGSCDGLGSRSDDGWLTGGWPHR